MKSTNSNRNSSKMDEFLKVAIFIQYGGYVPLSETRGIVIELKVAISLLQCARIEWWYSKLLYLIKILEMVMVYFGETCGQEEAARKTPQEDVLQQNW